MKRVFQLFFSFLVLISSLGVYLTNKVLYIKKKDGSFIFKRETEAGRFRSADFEALPKREVRIRSPYGYFLKGVLVEPHPTNRYMVFSHGVTESKINSIKYMNLFLERGFNGLIYDQRRHGESGGKTTSYGHYEKFDLKAVVDWLKNEIGSGIILGIHGESMGAATMLLYAGTIEDGADFYIADCPFSDFKEQLAYRMKVEMKLPPRVFLPLGELFLRIREGFSYADVSPITIIEKIKKPILFIHSEKDDYILPSMTIALFKRKKGPKKLFLAKKGLHAQSFNENRDDYEKAIDEFLDNHVFPHKQ